jgi:hypothetical protein
MYINSEPFQRTNISMQGPFSWLHWVSILKFFLPELSGPA